MRKFRVPARCVAALVAFFALSSTVLAQAAANFDLPAQPLADSLRAVAGETNTDILFDPTAVAKKTAPALRAKMTVNEALTRLLAGTGIKYEFVNEHTVVLVVPGETGAGAGKDRKSNAPSKHQADATSSTNGAAEAAPPSSQSVEPMPNPPSQPAESEGLQEILVTGTYLHGAAPITPVTTITQIEMLNQGYTRLSDVIENLPQNFRGGASSTENPMTGFGNGALNNFAFASGINLRGLGAGATLVLLNGRRLAPTALGGITDISSIPVSVIDRVEILTDGASALYGSDAVAGVVNIITKKDFSGFEVGARSSSIAEGKTPDYGGYVLGGSDWSSGGLVAAFDYEKDNPLRAINRSFSSNDVGGELLPHNEKSQLYLSLHNDFTDRLTLSADALASVRKYEGAASRFVSLVEDGQAHQYQIAAQLDYRLSNTWNATLVSSFSREQDHSDIAYYFSPSFIYAFSSPIGYNVGSVEPRIDGTLFSSPGGPVKLAAGAQFRWEGLNYSAGGEPLTTLTRHVDSVYGELLIPLVGAENAVPFVQRLRLDLSGRYDDYSDIGHSTNPKIGVEWVPIDGLTFHSSYARSFQAPTLYESSSILNFAEIATEPDPKKGPGGTSLVMVVDGTNPNLKPETAKSFNAGLTFAPSVLPGLKIDASYFHIDFDNQINRLINSFNFYGLLQQTAALGSFINLSPTPAEINAEFAVPGRTFYDYSGPVGSNLPQTQFTPPGPFQNNIAAIASMGYQNAGSVQIRGVDLSARYASPEFSLGRITADIEGTYFLRYAEQLTPTSQTLVVDNTFFNPLRLRAKADLGWEFQDFFANARINFSNAYGADFDANCVTQPNCSVSSWTTLDLALTYAPRATSGWIKGFRVTGSVSNLFNKDPPYVAPANTNTVPYGFDPVNGSPLLRAFGVVVTKRF